LETYINQEIPSTRGFSTEELLDLLLEEGYQPLKDKTIIQKSTAGRKFIVVPNNIPYNSVDIMTRCSCSDYFYTWAYYNANHNCLIGTRPPAYARKKTKADGSFITIRNPKQRPGVCKHLMLFIAVLMKGGLIQNLPALTSSAPDVGDVPNLRPNLNTFGDDIISKRLMKIGRTQVDKLLKDLKEDLKDLGQIRRGFNY
jgi:hypothetical protein